MKKNLEWLKGSSRLPILRMFLVASTIADMVEPGRKDSPDKHPENGYGRVVEVMENGLIRTGPSTIFVLRKVQRMSGASTWKRR